MPSYAENGALFSLGADYHEIGRLSGLLAAKVLRGASPAGIPVENLLPEQFATQHNRGQRTGAGMDDSTKMARPCRHRGG